MICRLWRGWTPPADADTYEAYLREQLFPRLRAELGEPGYRGFDLVRRDDGDAVEFVTLVWFDSLDAVRSFAGDAVEAPVISETARTLLSRYDSQATHYELRAADGSKGLESDAVLRGEAG